jgi:hypothetical protein
VVIEMRILKAYRTPSMVQSLISKDWWSGATSRRALPSTSRSTVPSSSRLGNQERTGSVGRETGILPVRAGDDGRKGMGSVFEEGVRPILNDLVWPQATGFVDR